MQGSKERFLRQPETTKAVCREFVNTRRRGGSRFGRSGEADSFVRSTASSMYTVCDNSMALGDKRKSWLYRLKEINVRPVGI
jgi:hypothetical protein